jgi:hypothetical protein
MNITKIGGCKVGALKFYPDYYTVKTCNLLITHVLNAFIYYNYVIHLAINYTNTYETKINFPIPCTFYCRC